MLVTNNNSHFSRIPGISKSSFCLLNEFSENLQHPLLQHILPKHKALALVGVIVDDFTEV